MEGLEHTICFSVLCCNVLLVLDNGCKLMQRVLCAEVGSRVELKVCVKDVEVDGWTCFFCLVLSENWHKRTNFGLIDRYHTLHSLQFP